MKAKDLHAVWSEPDNSRLTAKQFSFRLPVHVAAKLAAIGDMYPNKTRTQIVGDLLTTAIEEWSSQLPSVKGQFIQTHVEAGCEPVKIFEEVGPIGRYQKLTNAHFIELEKELGNESPEPFFGERVFVEEMTQEEVEREALARSELGL